MGSINSEHSGSINSDEFVAFLGRNHALPINDLQLLPLDNADSVHTDEVMGEPFSPRTQQRISEQMQLIVIDGTWRDASGPSVSSAASALSLGEVNSVTQNTNPAPELPTLASLKDTVQVKNGVLTISHLEIDQDAQGTTEKGEISKAHETQAKKVTWSNIVTRNVVDSVPLVMLLSAIMKMAPLRYPKMKEEDFVKACPFCRDICNCKSCLRLELPIKNTTSLSKEDKFHHSKYLLKRLLPFVRKFNEQQNMEKKMEAKIRGLSISEVKMKAANCPVDERLYWVINIGG